MKLPLVAAQQAVSACLAPLYPGTLGETQGQRAAGAYWMWICTTETRRSGWSGRDPTR